MSLSGRRNRLQYVKCTGAGLALQRPRLEYQLDVVSTAATLLNTGTFKAGRHDSSNQLQFDADTGGDGMATHLKSQCPIAPIADNRHSLVLQTAADVNKF